MQLSLYGRVAKGLHYRRRKVRVGWFAVSVCHSQTEGAERTIYWDDGGCEEVLAKSHIYGFEQDTYQST